MLPVNSRINTIKTQTLNTRVMQHCESINLDEYRQSGEGGTAITYKHNSRNSLAKLYKSGFEADMAIEEFKVAQAVYDLGIPTPKPYRLVTDGERLGAEYEFISGKRSFARILSQEPEKMPELVEAFAKAALELHATAADTDRIPAIREVLHSFYLSSDAVTSEYRKRALAFLDKIQEPSTCVHGDFHIGNIITDGNRTLWIDIGQFGYGAPEWDLGWFWTITHNLGDNRADFLLHLTQETLVSFWDAFLPAYLGTSAPTALREYTRKILAYYAVRVPFMFNLVHHDKFPEEGCKSLIGLIP